jgi:hypothetical protein
MLLRVLGFVLSAVASLFDIMFKGQVSENPYHVVHVSRNANNGTTAGTFYLNSNNSSSNRNRNIGSHLAVSSTGDLALSAVRGEYGNPIVLGSESEQHGEQQR